MRKLWVMVAVASLASGAQADSDAINNALKNRSDLSQFYQAMVNTGVIHELNAGQSYTVFAPTNAAFAKVSPTQYPCFYSSHCKQEVAEIIRHHIIPGEVYVSDAARHQGGVYSLGNRFVAVAEPYRNSYAVDGHIVLTTTTLGGGMLYRIDGVIASDYELAMVKSPHYAAVSEDKTTTTTEKKVIDKVCPAGEECPDAVSTTVTRTTTTVVPPTQELSPGR